MECPIRSRRLPRLRSLWRTLGRAAGHWWHTQVIPAGHPDATRPLKPGEHRFVFSNRVIITRRG